MRVYHGTSGSAWTSIEHDGIQPHRAALGHAVFATPDPEIAACYAVGRLHPYGPDEIGIVLAFTVPDDITVAAGIVIHHGPVPADHLEVERWVHPGDTQPRGIAPVQHSIDQMQDASRRLNDAVTDLHQALTH